MRPLVWCLLSAALFGVSTPASKHLLGTMSPLLLSGLLYVGAAVAVMPGAVRERARLTTADRKNWLCLLGAVLFGGVIGPVLLLFGLSLAPAGSVALWLNLETVSTAFIARIFFAEHLHGRTWIAVGLILAGSAILSPGSGAGLDAVLLVSLAAVAWGLDNNLTSVIDRFTPAQVTFAKGIAAGLINGSLGLLLSDGRPEAASIGLALVIGAASYGVSILLYIRGAQHLGATRSQLVFSTAPAWGLVVAWVVLREPMTRMQWLAAALMAIAIWLWNRERHGHEHEHVPTTHTHWHRHDDDHHEHAHPDAAPSTWHSHAHTHDAVRHSHEHQPDLHHRHEHDEERPS
ncbi:MAG: EamA family transporter [Deltaproteobacteria bacterium]